MKYWHWREEGDYGNAGTNRAKETWRGRGDVEQAYVQEETCTVFLSAYLEARVGGVGVAVIDCGVGFSIGRRGTVTKTNGAKNIPFWKIKRQFCVKVKFRGTRGHDRGLGSSFLKRPIPLCVVARR